MSTPTSTEIVSAHQHDQAMTKPVATPTDCYDPWLDLDNRWPEVRVHKRQLQGDLLGLVRLRAPIEITLRASSTPAQQRCTLTHEIVHLEREGPATSSGAGSSGGAGSGAGPPTRFQAFTAALLAAREERAVHTEVARRLIPVNKLRQALASGTDCSDVRGLAVALDVDRETIQLRLATLTTIEREQLRDSLRGLAELWNVA